MNTAINFLGTVWYVLCYLWTGGESGGDDEDEDDFGRRHDSDSDYNSSSHRGVPGQYLPPAEHNGYGSLADFSIPHCGSDGSCDTFQMY
jgi:hypothetical protein